MKNSTPLNVQIFAQNHPFNNNFEQIIAQS